MSRSRSTRTANWPSPTWRITSTRSTIAPVAIAISAVSVPSSSRPLTAEIVSTEVWDLQTWRGSDVLHVFAIDLGSRRVQPAASTPDLNEFFMRHVGRTLTGTDGLLGDHRIPICDRDRECTSCRRRSGAQCERLRRAIRTIDQTRLSRSHGTARRAPSTVDVKPRKGVPLTLTRPSVPSWLLMIRRRGLRAATSLLHPAGSLVSEFSRAELSGETPNNG